MTVCFSNCVLVNTHTWRSLGQQEVYVISWSNIGFLQSSIQKPNSYDHQLPCSYRPSFSYPLEDHSSCQLLQTVLFSFSLREHSEIKNLLDSGDCPNLSDPRWFWLKIAFWGSKGLGHPNFGFDHPSHCWDNVPSLAIFLILNPPLSCFVWRI